MLSYTGQHLLLFQLKSHFVVALPCSALPCSYLLESCFLQLLLVVHSMCFVFA